MRKKIVSQEPPIVKKRLTMKKPPIVADNERSPLEENSPSKSKNLQDLKLIPSGITTLNLACSNDPNGAFAAGRMVNLIGDSSSGKSIISWTMLAEINLNNRFRDYALIYDDVENANTFDLNYLFGSDVAERVQPPNCTTTDGEQTTLPSRTIEDFHCNICDRIDAGQPFIYILDSFDALDAEGDIRKIEEFRDAHKKNKKTAGTYSMAKPKKASEILRNICGGMKKTESFLMIISQTRDNIGIGFNPSTRSGGKALKFYAHHEIWLTINGSSFKSKGRAIGQPISAKVTKNKLTGKVREAAFSIYYDYGVDDINSMINFVMENDPWTKDKNTIIIEDLGSVPLSGQQSTIVKEIENRRLEPQLRNKCKRIWDAIEADLKLDRRPRYRELE